MTEKFSYNESATTPLKRDLSHKETLNTKEKIYSENYEKEINIFTDEVSRSWYELKKAPQLQMFVALVGSTFTNISPIIKESMYTKLGEKINKLDKVVPFLKLSEKYQDRSWYKQEAYFSSGVDLSSVTPKSFSEAKIDRQFLELILGDNDHALPDSKFPSRNFIGTEKDGQIYYTFFDFDNASISEIDPLKFKEKCLDTIGIDKVNKETAQTKLQTWYDFISSSEGKEFILAAYRKANLDKNNERVKEINEEFLKCIQKGASKDRQAQLAEDMKRELEKETMTPEKVYQILCQKAEILLSAYQE